MKYFATAVISIIVGLSWGHAIGKKMADNWYAAHPVKISVPDALVEAVMPKGCEIRRAWVSNTDDRFGIPTGTLGVFEYYQCSGVMLKEHK